MDANDHTLPQIQEWIAAYGGPAVALADLLCDRHATQPERLAARFEDAAGREVPLTFAELRDRSARFAGVLRDLGVGKGDRVATLLPKTPELLIATLALWRLGAVHVPLFTAFGPQAIAFRVEHSGTRLLVTDAANRPKLGEPWDVRVAGGYRGGKRRQRWAPGRHPLLAGARSRGSGGIAGHDWRRRPDDPDLHVRYDRPPERRSRAGQGVSRDRDLYALRVRRAAGRCLLEHRRSGLGLWPLLRGGRTAPARADDALLQRAVRRRRRPTEIWRKHGVTNFAAAPTVYRALRAAGVPAGANEWLRLRVASSAGEPLNPEVIAWAAEALAVPLHDHYGQTEHGMLVNNHHAPRPSPAAAPRLDGPPRCPGSGW